MIIEKHLQFYSYFVKIEKIKNTIIGPTHLYVILYGHSVKRINIDRIGKIISYAT